MLKIIEDNKNNNDTYVFVDFSNIYIGFYNHIINNYKKYKICNPKMDYNALFSIIERNKNIKKKILISSKFSKNTKKNIKLEKEKKIFNDFGYEVHFLERIHNKEQVVDELLHNKIMETLLYSKTTGTIIIASGDGKQTNLTDNSFYKLCIQALKLGWYVTIISWKFQLSKKYIIGSELYNILKDDNIKNKFDILLLENYIEMLII